MSGPDVLMPVSRRALYGIAAWSFDNAAAYSEREVAGCFLGIRNISQRNIVCLAG